MLEIRKLTSLSLTQMEASLILYLVSVICIRSHPTDAFKDEHVLLIEELHYVYIFFLAKHSSKRPCTKFGTHVGFDMYLVTNNFLIIGQYTTLDKVVI